MVCPVRLRINHERALIKHKAWPYRRLTILPHAFLFCLIVFSTLLLTLIQEVSVHICLLFYPSCIVHCNVTIIWAHGNVV